jgi:hypothetical protein
MGWSLREYDNALAEQLRKWRLSMEGFEHIGLEGDGEE